MTRTRYLYLVAVAFAVFALGVRGVESVVDYQRAKIAARAAHVQCDTDTDCMLKHGGDGSPK